MLPLKLTNFAPENGSHLEKEIPNLEIPPFFGAMRQCAMFVSGRVSFCLDVDML